MLATCQSEVTSVDEGTWDSSTNLETIFGDEVQTTTPATINERNAIHLPTTLSMLSQPLAFHHSQPQVLNQEYGHHSQEFVGTLSEGADPSGSPLFFSHFLSNAYHMARLELLFSHTSISASYELGTQPFQFIPELMPEGQIFSHSSGNRHQELRLSVVQGGKEKVRCTWSGCSRIVNEDNHARHVDETHLQKARDVCTSCGRVFPRMYMKKNHICHGPHSKRRRS
jgi:hypothetical protein